MAKRRVVITGAAGYVGQRMFKELAERWDLVPIDVIGATRGGDKLPGLVVADLTRPNRDEYRQHFRGADAVIHLGYVRAAGWMRRPGSRTTTRSSGRSTRTSHSPTTSIAWPSRRACGGWSWRARITRRTTTSA
jgi:hypothetical protein